MKLQTLLAAVLMLAVAAGAWAQQDPPRTPEDEAAFREYARVGWVKMTPALQKRLGFWVVYDTRKTAMQQGHVGALLTEDFEADELSLSVREETTPEGIKKVALPGEWRIWSSDPGIKTVQENGRLHISGTSTRDSGLNFNGLVGNTRGTTDVVAIAEMKSVGPPLDYPGWHLAMFHLCGSFPDLFNEVRFGRDIDDTVGWSHFCTGGPVLHHGEWPPMPPFGDEAERFYPIKLEHVDETQISRGWVKSGGEWKQVGGERPVVMTTTKLELKVNVPSGGAEVDVYFDNCRMYPRPETHPVRFIVFTHAETAGTMLKGVKITLDVEGADKPVSCTTNELGRAAVTLPANVDYPAAATVKAEKPGCPAWETKIERKGLAGLYPDDAWVIRLNEAELKGDSSWWKEFHPDFKE